MWEALTTYRPQSLPGTSTPKILPCLPLASVKRHARRAQRVADRATAIVKRIQQIAKDQELIEARNRQLARVVEEHKSAMAALRARTVEVLRATVELQQDMAGRAAARATAPSLRVFNMVRAFAAHTKRCLGGSTPQMRQAIVDNFLQEYEFRDLADRAVFAEYCRTGILRVPKYFNEVNFNDAGASAQTAIAIE